MKKLINFYLFLSIFNNYIINAADAKYENSNNIIIGASYLLYKRNSKTTEYATFYTYDGNPIKKIINTFGNSDNLFHSAMEKIIDANAPKPQPYYYDIKYSRGVSLAFGLIRKSPESYFIYFYDKNKNVIFTYPYNKKEQKITVFVFGLDSIDISTKVYSLKSVLENKEEDFPLDLSKVQKIENNNKNIRSKL